MCLKNIRSFLAACTQYFNISEADLFNDIELYDVSDFAQVRELNFVNNANYFKLISNQYAIKLL